MGVTFDPWQDGMGRAVLAKRADGLYAADPVVISIPRQVAKTFFIRCVVFALCIIHPGTTVVWTAHRLRTASETFADMQGFAKLPEVAPWIDQVRRGAGDQAVLFKNGSRILFGARERGFGRGFTGVDVLVLDEAQILTDGAMDDMVPTTNQAENPLILLAGTPPRPQDPGEVFGRLRAEAMSGESSEILLVEFSADQDADPDDRAQWRKANPSYPKRTPARSMLRMKKMLAADSFRREALGIWDAEVRSTVINPAEWAAQVAANPPTEGRVAYGLDMAPDRTTLAISAARLDDDTVHVETVKHESTSKGTAWAVEWLVERWPDASAVVIDAQSPAMSLLPELDAAKVKVTVTNTGDMVKACGMFVDAVRYGTLTHFDQPALNDAVANATKRMIGQAGGWGWNRKNPAVDITPLVSATLAVYGVRTSTRRPGRKSRMVVMA